MKERKWSIMMVKLTVYTRRIGESIPVLWHPANTAIKYITPDGTIHETGDTLRLCTRHNAKPHLVVVCIVIVVRKILLVPDWWLTVEARAKETALEVRTERQQVGLDVSSVDAVFGHVILGAAQRRRLSGRRLLEVIIGSGRRTGAMKRTRIQSDDFSRGGGGCGGGDWCRSGCSFRRVVDSGTSRIDLCQQSVSRLMDENELTMEWSKGVKRRQ